MDIKLNYDELIDDYVNDDYQSNWVLCRIGLQEYFDLDDCPKTITLRLTKVKADNSYFVKRLGNCFIHINLSNGFHEERVVYRTLSDLINRLGGECYLSIIA